MSKPSSTTLVLRIALLVSSFWVVAIKAQSSTTSQDRTSTNGHVSYPTGSPFPVFNNIDVLDVSYTTNWTHTNLTLFCETNKELNAWVLVSRPLIDQEGTFSFDPVQKDMDIPQFPVTCHFDLRNPSNKNDYALGGAFIMTSTAGPTRTHADATASPTSVQTSAKGGTDGKTTGSPTPPDDSKNAGSKPSALSSGAAIGIGVGVGLGVLIFGGAAAFFIWRRRVAARKRHQNIVMPDNRNSYVSAYTEEDEFKEPFEGDGRPIYQRPELDSVTPSQENHFVAELPTSPIGRESQRFGR